MIFAQTTEKLHPQLWSAQTVVHHLVPLPTIVKIHNSWMILF